MPARSQATGVRGYALIVMVLLAVFLAAFLAVEALRVPLLTDPARSLDEVGVAAAAIGVGLLLVDVFVQRIVREGQRGRAEQRLARYAALAILVTRPVPMLAETTAIVAGTSTLPWRRAALAGALGNLVPALLYATAGAVAASLADQTLVFAVVIAVAALFWLLTRDAALAQPPESSARPKPLAAKETTRCALRRTERKARASRRGSSCSRRVRSRRASPSGTTAAPMS